MAKKKSSSTPASSKKTSKKAQPKKHSAPPPFPLAMVVCDAIHRDPSTGKLFILGSFSIIGVEQLPSVHPLMGLYVELTNGRGNVAIKAQLIDADEEREPVWSAEQTIEFDDPRMIGQLAFQIVGTKFEHAGEYRFQLFANDEFLMERRVVVITQEQMK